MPTQAAARPSETDWGDVTRLLAAYRPRFNAILRRYAIPAWDAEDLLQDVLLLYLNKHRSVRSPAAWMAGTLRCVCIAYWRRRSAHRTADVSVLEHLPQPGIPPQERSDLARDLAGALSELRPAYRDVVLGRCYQDLSCAEVAARTDYRTSSIGKVLSRAKLQLATWMERSPNRWS